MQFVKWHTPRGHSTDVGNCAALVLISCHFTEGSAVGLDAVRERIAEVLQIQEK